MMIIMAWSGWCGMNVGVDGEVFMDGGMEGEDA